MTVGTGSKRNQLTSTDLLARSFLGLVLVFLYVPIAVMVAMAFNESVLYELPIRFTTMWFERLLENERLIRATINSVGLAVVNTVVATVLGTMAALAFSRYSFKGKTLMWILLFPPITIPWLIIGTAMLVLFFWTGIGRGLHAMLLGHVALSLPYVIVVVGARLGSFGPSSRKRPPPSVRRPGKRSGASPCRSSPPEWWRPRCSPSRCLSISS